MLKLAHIVNPVKVKEYSDLFVAQPITFKTMRVAQKFAQEYAIDVKLYSAQFPEDHSIIPDYLFKTPDLERSILDILDSSTLAVKRKLPLIKDILDRVYESADAEYIIYTNVDIALMPSFYITISKLIDQGYDALTINRRTISKLHEKIKDIPLMYSELGQDHPGHDCFLFKKIHYKKFVLNEACIGMSGLGRALFINLLCNANKLGEFKDLHLTFHLGDDKNWSIQAKKLEPYSFHNSMQVRKILEYYREFNQLPDHYLVSKVIEHHKQKLDGIKPKSNLIKKMRKKLRNLFQRMANNI